MAEKSLSVLSDNLIEGGIISTLLIHPEFILSSDYLSPSHFYNKESASIFWAISQLYKSGIDKIDSFNLMAMLSSNKGVKKIVDKFNADNIQEMIDISQHTARHTVEEYKMLAKQIATLSFKRSLYTKLKTFEDYCFNNHYELTDLNQLIYDDLNKLAEEYIITNDISVFGNQVDDLWNTIISRRSKDGQYGILSKFPEQNKYTTYEKGEMVVVAGMAKAGKSIYFINEALHAAKNNVPTVYFDTEMQPIGFMSRLLCYLTKIPMYKIKSGRYSQSEEDLINEAKDYIKKLPLVYQYIPSVTNEEVYTICKILKYKMDLQFVVYDYLKSNEVSTGNVYNDMGNKCDFLKNRVAGELDLSVLSGAQLNREKMMADSIKIERYASTVINIEPKSDTEIVRDGDQCGNFKIFIKLNRNGDMMSDISKEYIDVVADKQFISFEQSKQQHAPIEDVPK